MKALALAPVLALAAFTFTAPPLAEAAHRNGRDGGRSGYDSRRSGPVQRYQRHDRGYSSPSYRHHRGRSNRYSGRYRGSTNRYYGGYYNVAPYYDSGYYDGYYDSAPYYDGYYGYVPPPRRRRASTATAGTTGIARASGSSSASDWRSRAPRRTGPAPWTLTPHRSHLRCGGPPPGHARDVRFD